MGSYTPITRIAIIGGGPTAERAFDHIDIFEQRDRVGGVWNLSSNDRTKRIPIPQEDPRYGWDHDPKQTNGLATDNVSPAELNNDSLEFESPLYDYLEANIPKDIMQFSDTPFPDKTPLFASHEESLEYLERYADDVRHLIHFNVQVQNVKFTGGVPDSAQHKWMVFYKELQTSKMHKDTYDAVIVASGHYTVPHVAAIVGLSEWNQAYPGTVIHSKAYRRPEDFKGQRVLVIGNSASGFDIAYQIGPSSSQLYVSSRSESVFGPNQEIEWKEDIDEIVEFLPPKDYHRAVRTRSGKVVEDLDAVIFATGYFYSFPFLSELDPPLITDGSRTRDLYEHFLHIEYPTLALPVMNHKIIPFPLAEAQAAVIARLWSGRLQIPAKEEMRDWEKQEIDKMGSGKRFHMKLFPDDFAQVNDLYRWAASATPRAGLENDGAGKLGRTWDHYHAWIRSRFFLLKVAFAQNGKERRNIRTVKELGFDFDAWKRDAKPDDMTFLKGARCVAG